MENILERVRSERPIVHCITNYVTATDCANMLLAFGASPIMADDPAEAAEITARASALVLNLGTLTERRMEAMEKCAAVAKKRGIPIVLDPVGVGASKLRDEAMRRLLPMATVIRCNAAELDTIVLGDRSRGIDSDGSPALPSAMQLFFDTGALVAATGTHDVVTDGHRAYNVHNGTPWLKTVTGTGCMLSAMVGAFAAVSRAEQLEPVLCAFIAMGVCGEIAASRLGDADGAGTFHQYLLDAASRLTPKTLSQSANYKLVMELER